MTEFDRGPPAHLAALFARVPEPPIKDDLAWYPQVRPMLA
jgi:hypothetical protein